MGRIGCMSCAIISRLEHKRFQDLSNESQCHFHLFSLATRDFYTESGRYDAACISDKCISRSSMVGFARAVRLAATVIALGGGSEFVHLFRVPKSSKYLEALKNFPFPLDTVNFPFPKCCLWRVSCLANLTAEAHFNLKPAAHVAIIMFFCR